VERFEKKWQWMIWMKHDSSAFGNEFLGMKCHNSHIFLRKAG
jgi:hypothetical protein